MENTELTNYDKNNIDAIDRFLSDNGESCDYLQKTYTMVQGNSRNPVEITKESRKKCVKSLVR